MEIIRNADIARLVLGYLRDQNLENVADIFCKSSPYLKDEYRLKRKGFRLVSLGSGQLIYILREHCEIKSKVAHFTETIPCDIKIAFIKHSTLSEKISLILEAANKNFMSETQYVTEKSNLKRRRSTDTTDSFDIEATKIQDLPGYSPTLRKRRKVSGSYMFLNNNKDNYPNTVTDIDELQESSASMSSESEAGKTPNSNISGQQSISTTSKELHRVPSIPVISETLLENASFHNKLAENINKALQNSAKKQSPEKDKHHGENKSDTLTNQLEEIIKSILDETEKDPTFDEIVEEVVYTATANKTTSVINKSTQVSPTNEETTNDKNEELAKNSTLSNSEVSAPKICVTVPPHVQSISPQDVIFGECSQNIAANNSLDISLLDPNISISKLIVLNPNESFGAQLTSEQIIRAPTLSNIQGFSSLGEQVVIDMNTGQMTIPLSMANSGIDIPVFINTTACQENLSTVSSFAERIHVSVDQTSMPLESSTAVDIETKSTQTKQKKHEENMNMSTITMPASLDSRVAMQKVTPSTSKIIPQTARSLSTPRRRTSHVRVLNFSTPSVSNIKISNKNTSTVSEANDIPTSSVLGKEHEKNKEERLAPSTEAHMSKALTSSDQVTENSNSNSLDFAVDKSNETVIIRNISETPKRKTNNKKCGRNLSRSNSLEDQPQEMAAFPNLERSRDNIQNTAKKPRKRIYRRKKEEPPENTEDKLDPMEQWQKMRTAVTSKNFDQHLRDIASKTGIVAPRSSKTKRRRRRIRNKSIVEEHVDTNESNQGEQSISGCSVKKSESLENKNAEQTKTSQSDLKTAIDIESSMEKLINFKISTPVKQQKVINYEKKSNKMKKKKVGEKCKDNPENDNIANISNVHLKSDAGNSLRTLQISPNKCLLETDENVSHCQDDANQINKDETEAGPSSRQEHKCDARETFQKTIVHREMEKRTANIAHLLDTPFKDVDPSSCPFTPRFLIPEAQDTPITKLMNSIRQISAAKNFDVPTPSVAITPGSSLTPKEKETPHSGYRSNYATDYSSGGSYYKPDESKDLDKHLDQILSAERQKRKLIEKGSSKADTTENKSAENVLETIKIPVPAVLERVKSFSDDVRTVTPHYTFAEGLPENINESTSSDSSNSSTSSSSSSSSSDSSSVDSRLSLSDIDSSEDEEWRQQSLEIANEQHNENSLITEDGEVRYPLRNWITPKKSDPDSPTKDELKPGSSTENSRQQKKVTEAKTKQLTDLEEKRLRIKNKLKEDLLRKDNKQTVKVIKRERVAITRKISKPTRMTLRRTNPSINKISPQSRENSKDVPYKADNQVDMLKALNLSKRSKEVDNYSTLGEKSITILFGSSNDNAVNNETFSCVEKSEDSEEVDQVRKAALALTTMQNKKTKFIEAIPQAKKRGRPRKQQLSPMRLRGRINKNAKVEKPKVISKIKSTKGKGLQKFVGKKSTPILKEAKIVLQNLSKQEIIAFPHKPSDNIRLEVKSSASPPSITIQPIQISEIRSSMDEIPGTSLQVKETSPVVTSNTKEEEQSEAFAEDGDEDEDPYDLCKLVTSNENDSMRYKQYVYIGPDHYVPSSTNDSIHNLLTSVMNIFLEGKPHVLKVTDEIELFSSKQQFCTERGKVKLIKNIPKKRNRKEHIEAYTKKCVKPTSSKKAHECVINTSHISEDSEDSEYPPHTSTPVQPKVRVVFKDSNLKVKPSKDDSIKGNISTDGSGSAPAIDDDCVSSSTSAQTSVSPHTEQSAHTIKAEDINAVLSHLHGDD